MKLLSCVQLFATPWTIAHQASQSMGFSRQEYWSGLPFPSPGDLPHREMEPGPRSPAFQADALTSEPPGKQQEEPESEQQAPLLAFSLREGRASLFLVRSEGRGVSTGQARGVA